MNRTLEVVQLATQRLLKSLKLSEADVAVLLLQLAQQTWGKQYPQLKDARLEASVRSGVKAALQAWRANKRMESKRVKKLKGGRLKYEHH